MAKQLKKWNGRGHFQYQNCSLFVAAYTQKQCAELVSLACSSKMGNKKDLISTNEIRDYYSFGVWGICMDHINIEDIKYPSVWVQERLGTPKLVFELKQVV